MEEKKKRGRPRKETSSTEEAPIVDIDKKIETSPVIQEINKSLSVLVTGVNTSSKELQQIVVSTTENTDKKIGATNTRVDNLSIAVKTLNDELTKLVAFLRNEAPPKENPVSPSTNPVSPSINPVSPSPAPGSEVTVPEGEQPPSREDKIMKWIGVLTQLAGMGGTSNEAKESSPASAMGFGGLGEAMKFMLTLQDNAETRALSRTKVALDGQANMFKNFTEMAKFFTKMPASKIGAIEKENIGGHLL